MKHGANKVNRNTEKITTTQEMFYFFPAGFTSVESNFGQKKDIPLRNICDIIMSSIIKFLFQSKITVAIS